MQVVTAYATLSARVSVTAFCRHEEMSNAIIFYINAWDTLPVPVGRAKPDMGTVTVSRRGIINVRLGWHDGTDWENNDEWIVLVDGIRDFLLTLC